MNKTLQRLHKEANNQKLILAKNILKGIIGGFKPKHFEDAYISISEDQGKIMHEMIVAKNCKHIVEFGTPFEISTLYLAEAAKVTKGKVITSELLESKATIATNNFIEAGLIDWIDLRIGDAMITLKDTPDHIDFLFLDGWKDLYLPLLSMLEPKLKTNAVVVLDNIGMGEVKLCSQYVESNAHYTQIPIPLLSNRAHFYTFKK